MLVKPELSMCTDEQATIFQELFLGGGAKPLCPRSLGDMTVLSLGFGLTGFSSFMLKRFRNLGSIGRMYILEATRLEGRQLSCSYPRLQDQSFGVNTGRGPCGFTLKFLGEPCVPTS